MQFIPQEYNSEWQGLGVGILGHNTGLIPFLFSSHLQELLKSSEQNILFKCPTNFQLILSCLKCWNGVLMNSYQSLFPRIPGVPNSANRGAAPCGWCPMGCPFWAVRYGGLKGQSIGAAHRRQPIRHGRSYGPGPSWQSRGLAIISGIRDAAYSQFSVSIWIPVYIVSSRLGRFRACDKAQFYVWNGLFVKNNHRYRESEM